VPAIDPTTRLVRRVLLGVYSIVAVGFCGLLAVGIWQNLRDLKPEPPVTPVSAAQCVQDLQALRQELVDALAKLPSAPPSSDQPHAYDQWQRVFRSRLLLVKANCARPAGGTPAQAEAVHRAVGALQRFLDLSEITVAHWSRHLGPASEATEAALVQAAREAGIEAQAAR
jgi:hypothetical protein